MGHILLSVLVMAVIAGFLGCVLSFAQYRLKEEKNPAVDKVEELLPGVNCGLCGYPNCHEFAKALMKGDTEITNCVITSKSKEKMEEVNQLLQQEKDKKK
jgi:electron transport complex protein RnfB